MKEKNIDDRVALIIRKLMALLEIFASLRAENGRGVKGIQTGTLVALSLEHVVPNTHSKALVSAEAGMEAINIAEQVLNNIFGKGVERDILDGRLHDGREKGVIEGGIFGGHTCGHLIDLHAQFVHALQRSLVVLKARA